MNEDKIPSNQDDLTAGNGLENPSGSDPINQQGSTEAELDPKTKEGFQRLIAKRDRELEEEKRRALEHQEELRKLREERRQQKLQELDETERLKVERDELAGENAKLRMQHFAVRELQRRTIKPTDPIYEIVSESPWLVPFVRRSLGDQPNWHEVIQAVEDKLPAYLDQVASKNGETPAGDTPSTPSQETAPSKVEAPKGDPERQPNDNSKKRIWTRKEIANLSDQDYVKNRDEIKKAQVEGRIIAG